MLILNSIFFFILDDYNKLELKLDLIWEFIDIFYLHVLLKWFIN